LLEVQKVLNDGHLVWLKHYRTFTNDNEERN